MGKGTIQKDYYGLWTIVDKIEKHAVDFNRGLYTHSKYVNKPAGNNRHF